MLHRFFGPNLFVEADPDPENPNAVPERRAGVDVPLTNAQTGETLAPTTSLAGGYLYVELDDVPAITFETKRWDGSQYVPQTITALSDVAQWLLFTQGDTSVQALTKAQSAEDTANYALDVANSVQTSAGVASINGYAGVVQLTAGDVGARSASEPVPAGSVSGLAPVAKTGKYTDLEGRPPASIPVTDRDQPNGVPTLGGDQVVKSSQLGPRVIPWGDPATRPVDESSVGVWWFTSTEPTAAMSKYDMWINTSTGA